jgi:hypothetical protein
MPLVLVRNNQKGPTVFQDHATKESVEWGGKGDPMHNDVQQVPEAFLENVNFRRAVNRGILEIVEAEPEILAKFESQSEMWRKRIEQEEEQAKLSLNEVANRDIVQVSCIGPDSRGTGQCANPVPVAELQKGDAPPLCGSHRHLIDQFVLTESATEVEADGFTPKKVWTRVVISQDALPSQS